MKIWQAIAAAALSAALFHLGTGLDPVPWVTWLAPLPVLLVASRVKGWAAFGAGTFTWAAGQAALWPYFLNVIELPLLIIAVSQLAAALVFGLAVVGHRFLLLRGRPLSGAVVVPAAWVVMEYVISLVMPHGAWWSLAYTQAEVLPVLQTASATGIWGITFLLLGVPSAVSAVVGARSAARNEPVGRRADTGGVSSTPGRTPDAPGPGAAGPGSGGPGSGGPGAGSAGAGRRGGGSWGGKGRVVVVFGGLVVVALAYGGWQLREAPVPTRAGDRVALVATDRPNDVIALDTAQGRDLVRRYVAQVERVAEDGARVVVIPEKTFLADERSLPVLAGPLARVAREHGADVVAGLVMSRGGTLYNVALDFPADGGEPVEYIKKHLIPGLEDALRPGGGLVFAPGTRWGLIICKDLDHPDLVRSYRAAGATALLAPAWDFGGDGWLHSRMAVVRGVENGLAIARPARAGQVLVSDPNGRIVAEAATTDAEFVEVTAALPAPAAPTLYARLGDWFAWLSVALLVLALVPVPRRRRAV